MSPDYNKVLPYKERRFLCKVGFHSYEVVENYIHLSFIPYVGCKHCFKAHSMHK